MNMLVGSTLSQYYLEQVSASENAQDSHEKIAISTATPFPLTALLFIASGKMELVAIM